MSAESGQDLICAGVSCIVMGGYNALNEITNSEFDYKMEDGYFKIVTNRNDLETQTILKTIIIQLETMHRSYAQYIKIEKMEV